jgi:hypothetical protein
MLAAFIYSSLYDKKTTTLLFIDRVAALYAKGGYMNKFGPKAQEKVEEAMHEMKAGKLRSGRSDQKVTSRKQAVAIGLSEAREAGGKVPKK